MRFPAYYQEEHPGISGYPLGKCMVIDTVELV